MIPNWNDRFARSWAANGYEGNPVGHEQIQLRTNEWVRFHSFSDKQHPENPADDKQVFDRFAAVGNALFSRSEEIYYLSPWVSGTEDPDRDAELRWSVRATLWQAMEWKQVLLSTAYDHEMSFGLFSPHSGCFLSPYEGGLDVFEKDSAARDALAVQFRAWLPKHPIKG